jgi:hypothetical protein
VIIGHVLYSWHGAFRKMDVNFPEAISLYILMDSSYQMKLLKYMALQRKEP